jgi:hypothetical protein
MRTWAQEFRLQSKQELLRAGCADLRTNSADRLALPSEIQNRIRRLEDGARGAQMPEPHFVEDSFKDDNS